MKNTQSTSGEEEGALKEEDECPDGDDQKEQNNPGVPLVAAGSLTAPVRRKHGVTNKGDFADGARNQADFADGGRILGNLARGGRNQADFGNGAETQNLLSGNRSKPRNDLNENARSENFSARANQMERQGIYKRSDEKDSGEHRRAHISRNDSKKSQRLNRSLTAKQSGRHSVDPFNMSMQETMPYEQRRNSISSKVGTVVGPTNLQGPQQALLFRPVPKEFCVCGQVPQNQQWTNTLPHPHHFYAHKHPMAHHYASYAQYPILQYPPSVFAQANFSPQRKQLPLQQATFPQFAQLPQPIAQIPANMLQFPMQTMQTHTMNDGQQSGIHNMQLSNDSSDQACNAELYKIYRLQNANRKVTELNPAKNNNDENSNNSSRFVPISRQITTSSNDPAGVNSLPMAAGQNMDNISAGINQAKKLNPENRKEIDANKRAMAENPGYASVVKPDMNQSASLLSKPYPPTFKGPVLPSDGNAKQPLFYAPWHLQSIPIAPNNFPNNLNNNGNFCAPSGQGIIMPGQNKGQIVASPSSSNATMVPLTSAIEATQPSSIGQNMPEKFPVSSSLPKISDSGPALSPDSAKSAQVTFSSPVWRTEGKNLQSSSQVASPTTKLVPKKDWKCTISNV